MRLVYIAGKLTTGDREHNIRVAADVADMVVVAGRERWAPVVMHTMTNGVKYGDDAYWLKAAREVLQRCDAVLFLPDFRESPGAWTEHRDAVRMRMPMCELSSTTDMKAVYEALKELDHYAH